MTITLTPEQEQWLLAQVGLLAFESGDTISHQEHVARNQARLAAMTTLSG